MYILFSPLILLQRSLCILFIYLFIQSVCGRQIKFRISTSQNDSYYVTNEVSRVSFESSPESSLRLNSTYWFSCGFVFPYLVWFYICCGFCNYSFFFPLQEYIFCCPLVAQNFTELSSEAKLIQKAVAVLLYLVRKSKPVKFSCSG